MEALLSPLIPAFILLALVFLPLTVVVGTVLFLKRVEKRDARRSPLSDKLLHQAGAQARKKVDELNDSLMERLVQVMMIGPMVMLVILLPRVRWANLKIGWVEWLIVAGASVAIAWLTRHIVQLRRQRRLWEEGMRAEIAAAQRLDRLQAQECFVLHDIPVRAKDFNIDHVVIAPHAVFAVETKSRRKPGQGKASANVTYDGKALRFPGWIENRPVEQARAIADWLSNYLRAETGEPVVVHPVVCLPGWFVTLAKGSTGANVRVVNPKMTSLFVEAGGRPRMEPSQRNRILNALQKCYPDAVDGESQKPER